VGYEEGGKLTEAVRRRPYCLVLLDELEKAHPDVCGILLQVMEEGELTDSTGRKVSFKNTIVVMTSNVGSEVKGDGLGFRPAGEADGRKAALKQMFRPEFLGRLDRITAFSPLSPDALTQIAEKELRELSDRLQPLGLQLTFPKEIAAWLACQCRPKEGARQLRNLVREKAEGPLSLLILQQGSGHGKVRCRLDGEFLRFLI
jgi:ATP-dependent Clp protease ATP-binding subunit ClpA